MEKIIRRLAKFRDDRDWAQFHTPENLAKSIMIEGAELLEHFQWDNNIDITDVSEEIADVMAYCMLLADRLGINMEEAMNRKIDKNEEKYPADLVRGSSKKYTEYKHR